MKKIFIFLLFISLINFSLAVYINENYDILSAYKKKYYSDICNKYSLNFCNNLNFDFIKKEEKNINLWQLKKLLFYSQLYVESRFWLFWWIKLKDVYSLKDCWYYYNNNVDCFKEKKMNTCSVCKIIYWLQNIKNWKEEKNKLINMFLNQKTSSAGAMWAAQFLPYIYLHEINKNNYWWWKHINNWYKISYYFVLMDNFYKESKYYYLLDDWNIEKYFKCNNYYSRKYEECKILRNLIYKYNHSVNYINSIINYMQAFYNIKNLDILWNPLWYFIKDNKLYFSNKNFYILRNWINYVDKNIILKNNNYLVLWYWNIENIGDYLNMKNEKALVLNILWGANCYYIEAEKNKWSYIEKFTKYLWNFIICINKNWWWIVYSHLSNKTKDIIYKYNWNKITNFNYRNSLYLINFIKNITKITFLNNDNKRILIKRVIKFKSDKWDIIWIIWKTWELRKNKYYWLWLFLWTINKKFIINNFTKKIFIENLFNFYYFKKN